MSRPSTEEALRIGLLTRLAAPGQALAEAQQLARTIAAFPQIAMRSDRRSAYEQWDLGETQAIANELAHSVEARRREAVSGAQRFAAGEGRHGAVGAGSPDASVPDASVRGTGTQDGG